MKTCGESMTSCSVSSIPVRLLQPVDDLAGLAAEVVGDDDRPVRRVDVEHEVVEPVAGGLADPADLLLGRRPGEARGSARCSLQDPRREPDDVRLAAGERERPPPAAADEERRMRPLDRLREARRSR